MNAMILAAGRGERMRPLSDHCPKPLLMAGGKTLLDWHLQGLKAAGCQRVVINIAWLGEKIRAHLETIDQNGMEWVISDEGEQALETAGGIMRARAFLGDAPFWLVNGDVWSDFAWQNLPRPAPGGANLVMVENPSHHPQGDFVLDQGQLKNTGTQQRVTYAGLGCFDPRFFDDLPSGVQPLGPLLRKAADQGRLTGMLHHGLWFDVGTRARLDALNARLSSV